ncbi:nuclear transport factor 2 family protein [Myxococcota bacterium]|nr:nuclear transport factor 2 family protein [Myxococcota bacterium]
MDHHKTLERFFPAMFGDERETLGELFDEDIVWLVPPSVAEQLGEMRGRQSVIDFLCSAGGELFEPGSLQLDPHLQVVEGDAAVVVAQMRARTANGAPYQNEYAFSFLFRDGRICEVRELLDTANFQAQFNPDTSTQEPKT